MSNEYLAEWGIPGDIAQGPGDNSGLWYTPPGYRTPSATPEQRAVIYEQSMVTGIPPAVLANMYYNYANHSDLTGKSALTKDAARQRAFNLPYTEVGPNGEFTWTNVDGVQQSPPPPSLSQYMEPKMFGLIKPTQREALEAMSKDTGIPVPRLMRLNGLLPDDGGGWL